MLKYIMQVQDMQLYHWAKHKDIIKVYIVMQHIRLENIRFIKCWNIAGKLHNPIGITRYSNNPYGIRKVVLCLLPSRICT